MFAGGSGFQGRFRKALWSSRAMVAVSSVVVCSLLTGCSAIEAVVHGQPEELRVALPSGSELRAGASEAVVDALELRLDDTESESSRMTVEPVDVPFGEALDAVLEGEVELAIGCTGALLDQLDASKGEQLRQLYGEEDAPDWATWRDITHSTMLAALPANFAVSIPGEAELCVDDELPQQAVAIYDKNVLDREQRKAINDAVAGLQDEDLAKASESEDLAG